MPSVDFGSIFSVQNVVSNVAWALLIAGMVKVFQRFSGHKIWKGKPLVYWPVTVGLVFVLLTAVSKPIGANFSDSTIDVVSVGNASERADVKAPPSGPTGAGIVVFASLRNTGDPSAIDSPEVYLVNTLGRRFYGKIWTEIVLIDKDQKENLIKTAGINPSPLVVRGAIQKVRIGVFFSDVLPDEARRAGTKVRFSFKDAFRHGYEIEGLMTGEEHAF